MYHLGKIHLKKKQKQEAKRITEYMISGGAFFWSGYVALYICDKVLGLNLLAASSISYIVGWVVNYLLQRYWVFNNPKLAKHQTETTSRYIIISLVNLVINYAILENLKSIGITPYIGVFASSAFFTVWNYLWYKYWVFPEKFTPRRSARGQSPRRQRRSWSCAVSSAPVLVQRMPDTSHSIPRRFLAQASSVNFSKTYRSNK